MISSIRSSPPSKAALSSPSAHRLRYASNPSLIAAAIDELLAVPPSLVTWFTSNLANLTFPLASPASASDVAAAPAGCGVGAGVGKGVSSPNAEESASSSTSRTNRLPAIANVVFKSPN